MNERTVIVGVVAGLFFAGAILAGLISFWVIRYLRRPRTPRREPKWIHFRCQYCSGRVRSLRLRVGAYLDCPSCNRRLRSPTPFDFIKPPREFKPLFISTPELIALSVTAGFVGYTSAELESVAHHGAPLANMWGSVALTYQHFGYAPSLVVVLIGLLPFAIAVIWSRLRPKRLLMCGCGRCRLSQRFPRMQSEPLFRRHERSQAPSQRCNKHHLTRQTCVKRQGRST